MILNFGNNVINSDYIVRIQTMDCDKEHSIITLIDGSQITVRSSINEIISNLSTGCIGFPDKTPIDDLDLSVRALNVCKSNGVTTLGELINAIHTGTIDNFRNLGTKSTRELYNIYRIYTRINK